MLLAEFSNPELEAIIEVLRAHRSLSPFPMAAAKEARRADKGADLRSHVEAIAGEIVWWGTNELLRQIGINPGWKEIVAFVAKSLGVPPKERLETASCIAIEQAILRYEQEAISSASKNWFRITADWIGKFASFFGPNLTQQASQGVLKSVTALLMGGGEVAVVEGGAVAGAEGAAAAGGLSIAGAAAIAVAVVVAVTGVAYIAGGPSERVLRPVVTIVAAARQRLRDERMAESFAL